MSTPMIVSYAWLRATTRKHSAAIAHGLDLRQAARIELARPVEEFEGFRELRVPGPHHFGLTWLVCQGRSAHDKSGRNRRYIPHILQVPQAVQNGVHRLRAKKVLGKPAKFLRDLRIAPG